MLRLPRRMMLSGKRKSGERVQSPPAGTRAYRPKNSGSCKEAQSWRLRKTERRHVPEPLRALRRWVSFAALASVIAGIRETQTFPSWSGAGPARIPPSQVKEVSADVTRTISANRVALSACETMSSYGSDRQEDFM